MTRSASPRVTAYAVLAAAGLVGALAARRPELAVLAAPFAVTLALGLRLDRDPQVGVWLSLDRDRALERDELPLEVELNSVAPVERLELLLVVPDGLELVDGDNPTAVRLGRDDERTLALTLRCVRWGNYDLGRAQASRARPLRPARLGADGRPEAGASRLSPSRDAAPARAADGDATLHRQRGRAAEGRRPRVRRPPTVCARRPRSLDQLAGERAAGGSGELVVNDRHPERNTDVILFLDSFAEARDAERSTLDLAVRAAATLASRYLERRDRVGIVSFGGILRWLVPGMGAAQRYRIVDSLLETEIVFNYAWKDVSVIPSRTLPPQALVLAVTPLLDERSVAALLDLRARGYDLAVVEVSPEPFVRPGDSEADRLAHRLWLLHRQELRSRYERLGVAVASWDGEVPLDAALEGVRAFRRHARLARA